MKMHKLFPVALFAALALFLYSCDSPTKSDPKDNEEQQPGTVVEVAAANDDFSTLVTAINAAGLATTLNGDGPFTVFAPTNSAFAALPAGVLDDLLADPMGDLKDILLYHVVSGNVGSETVVTLDKAETVLGEEVSIKVMDGKVYLNETVMVTTTDIAASNGVIHVIDAVLLPPADEPELGTIVDVAASNADFSTLVTAVTEAGLVETLSGDGPFTVFAPTNSAFAALPAGVLDDLLADPMGDLKDILLYHVVSGNVGSETVVTLDKAETVLGEEVSIKVMDGKVYLNETVMVTTTDIHADNGIIHVIDAVLIP